MFEKREVEPAEVNLLAPGVLDSAFRDDDRGTLPVITLKDINNLARQLENYIDSGTEKGLASSSVLYWLTQGLHCTVSAMDQDATIRIGQVMYKLAVKNPDALIQMLAKTIDLGAFKGQNTAYIWTRELYMATLGTQNDSAILAINLVMTYLLDRGTQPLATALLTHCLEGGEKGKNGLYVLAQALRKLSESIDNTQITLVLAKLLNRSMAQLPVETDRDAIQDLKGGALLKDKHPLYMFVTALKYAAKDNPPVTKIICNIISRIALRQSIDHPDSAFFKVAASGEFKGLSATHIILTSLVSAAYKKNNNQVIGDLAQTLRKLFSVAPNQMTTALTQEIIRDGRAVTNGVSLLVQSLIAAIEHNLDIDQIADLIITLIKTNSKSMAIAFKQTVVLDGEGYTIISPLHRLMDVAKESLTEKNVTKLNRIISELAASPYGDELKSVAAHGSGGNPKLSDSRYAIFPGSIGSASTRDLHSSSAASADMPNDPGLAP